MAMLMFITIFEISNLGSLVSQNGPMPKNLYTDFLTSKKELSKRFAVLIDPDKMENSKLDKTISNALESGIDYFFIGGSLVVEDNLDYVLETIKDSTSIPTILFPGNTYQINERADAIFFLSVISGRNPELLIGQHVLVAPMLKKMDLEVIPTGYMIIDGGRPTTVSYMSNTLPIPNDRDDIAVCAAMAGEMMGLKMLYMDAGSGAKISITESMIEAVNQSVSIPIIAGGGITTPEKAAAICKAGADVIVVGNAIEKDPVVTSEIAHAIHSVEPVQ